MLQTHFKLAGPKKKKFKKIQKKKTCRTDPIEARDFIWLSGEGGDEGDFNVTGHTTWSSTSKSPPFLCGTLLYHCFAGVSLLFQCGAFIPGFRFSATNN